MDEDNPGNCKSNELGHRFGSIRSKRIETSHHQEMSTSSSQQHHHQEDKNEDGSANNEVDINQDFAAVHGGDNEVHINQDLAAAHGGDNEVNINQDLAAVHEGDNEVHINQDLAAVLGGLANVIYSEIIQASYVQLVRHYLGVFLGNPPHHEDNAADNYGLLVAIRRFLDVNNIYAPEAPVKEITVEMHRVNNQLVTAVIGPMGVLNINLEDHRRAYPPSRKEDPEVLNLEESSILVVNRAERVFIIKTLSNSDVSQKGARVALPLVFVRDQIIPTLLNDDDNLEEGIQVDVYSNQLKRFHMVFKTVSNKEYCVLQMGWKPFLVANGYLTANANVRISAFRHFISRKLCFSVVPA